MKVYRSKTIAWPYIALSFASFVIAFFPVAMAAMRHQDIETKPLGSALIFSFLGIWAMVSSFFILTIDDKGVDIRQGVGISHFPFSVIEEVRCIPTPDFPNDSASAVQIDIPRTPLPVRILAAYEPAYPWMGAPQAILLLCRGSKNNYVLPHPDAENIVGLIKTELEKQRPKA